MLLPVGVLARRADATAVIGSALAAKASGSGHRGIAAELGRPAETVRGWLRRFAGRVEAVRVVFTGWCRALSADPVLSGPAGSAWADAIAAITAAAGALGARFGLGEVPVWVVAAAVSGGRLLAPGWPPQLFVITHSEEELTCGGPTVMIFGDRVAPLWCLAGAMQTSFGDQNFAPSAVGRSVRPRRRLTSPKPTQRGRPADHRRDDQRAWFIGAAVLRSEVVGWCTGERGGTRRVAAATPDLGAFAGVRPGGDRGPRWGVGWSGRGGRGGGTGVGRTPRVPRRVPPEVPPPGHHSPYSNDGDNERTVRERPGGGPWAPGHGGLASGR
ncbi:MAG: hypothetical protein JO281_01940 [Pseudonocardiales bacterium]|nr:hypothetical protein [Pseudonocardiales bacterium]